MREIKFRAWGIPEKTMYEPYTLEEAIEFQEQDFAEDNIYMQYTGLKDKNGKEIYEGDILQWTDGTMEIGKVEWWDGDVCFETTPCLNGLDCIRCKGYSIIGNIYENPELLSDN